MMMRIYGNDYDSWKDVAPVYEGEFDLNKVKKLVRWCDKHSAEYEHYVPTFEVVDGVMVYYPSGPWEC